MRLLNCTGRIGVGRGALLLIVVGLVLSSVRPSAAQPAWTGVITPITAGVVRESKLAGDAAGNAIAAWVEGLDFSSATVKVARFNAQSRTWGAPTVFDTTGANGVNVVMNGAGDAVAYWTGSGGAVRAAKFVASSGTWSGPVSPDGAQTAGLPQGAIDPQGNALLVWEGFGASNTRLIRATRLSAAAGTWGAPVTVTSFAATNLAAMPRGVLDQAGVATIVFSTGFAATRAMLWSRSDIGSNAWSSPQILVQDNVSGPVLSADGGGNVFALWRSSAAHLLASRYVASSGSWSQSQDLGAAGFDVAVKADAPGNALALWIRTEGQQAVLASSVFSASSGAWTAAPSLSGPSVRPVLLPALAADGAGIFTAAWVNTSPQTGLYAARRSLGQPWSTPVPLFEGPSQQPSAAASTAGDVMVLAGGRSTRFSVLGAEALAAPTGLTISTFITPYGEALIGEPLTVSWSPNATGLPVTGYQIEAGSGTGLSDLASVRVGLVTQVAATVPVIRRIAIRVRAVNGNTVGPPSTEGFLVVAGVCDGQPAPRDLTSTVAGNLITLRWPATGLSTSYIVEAGSGPGLSNIASIPLSFNANRGISGAVGPGTYYIRVRAVGPCGTSDPSNEVVATIAGGPTTLPGAPVLDAPVVSGQTVSLSWSAGSGPAPTGYVLTGSLTPGGAPIASIPVTGTSVSFAGAPSGTFYLRLIATNAAGSSPPSAAVTLVVP